MYKEFLYITRGPHKGKMGECVTTAELRGVIEHVGILCLGEICYAAPEDVVKVPMMEEYKDFSDRKAIAS